jgi:hypothetical protein
LGRSESLEDVEIDNVAQLAAELKQVTEEIEEQRKLLSQDCSDHRQRSETIAIPQKNIYMEYPH